MDIAPTVQTSRRSNRCHSQLNAKYEIDQYDKYEKVW